MRMILSSFMNKCTVLIKFFFDLSKISNEEDRQKATILNLILIGFLTISFAAALHWLVYLVIVKGQIAKGATFWPLIIFIFLFLGLIKLSSSGRPKVSAYILIILILLATLQLSIGYGSEIPQAIVMYSLIIVVAGITIGPTTALSITLLIAIANFGIFKLNQNNIIEYYSDWKLKPFSLIDILVLNASYFAIGIVSWLSIQEINKSFRKAKKSEKEAIRLSKKLEKQNVNLEKIVASRTEELRRHQLRQLMEANSLAEFGKISAGLLHDIKNPLTVIAMNLDTIKDHSKDQLVSQKNELTELVNKSLSAYKTIESMIKTSQKQIHDTDKEEIIDLKKEIRNTLKLIDHRLKRENVNLTLDCPSNIRIKGYCSRLSRVIANLIMNSIDSFKDKDIKEKLIEISVEQNKENITISIIDNGCGIKDSDKENIFKPLFSTKKSSDRMGLGLNLSRSIINSYFKGNISFTSEYGQGSEFIIEIPTDHEK